MNKLLRSIFHFLGGIYLAISLIAIAAIAVIIGTFVESKTGSHLLAARWTYENPLFFLILFLFFVNILFSALRRWPFKKRHIPFLMTHLGLLMIISGTMIKNQLGLQGQLTVWEGSSNQNVLLPHSYSLLIEGKEGAPLPKNLIALSSFRPHIFHPYHFPQLKCKLVGYSPQVKEELETWIKGSKTYIAGFPSVSVVDWKLSTPFPTATSHPFALSSNFPTWSLLGIRTPYLTEAIKEVYAQNLILQFKTKGKEGQILTLPLKEALTHDFPFINGKIHINFDFNPLEEGSIPSLNFVWTSNDHQRKDKWIVPLQGQDSLLIKPAAGQWGELPLSLDLNRQQPLLCVMADKEGNTLFLAFDTYGRIHVENFNPSKLKSLMIYEQGFSGYGVQTAVLLPSFPAGREDKENGETYALSIQLREALAQNPSLAPPLQFFKEACQQANVDFVTTFVQFLTDWNSYPGLFYTPSNSLSGSVEKMLKNLDWQKISARDRQAIQWAIDLLKQLENVWTRGEDPIEFLEHHKWPLIKELKEKIVSENLSIPNLISMQVHSLASYLPSLDISSPPSPFEQALFLSAYLRTYGIDYRSLIPFRGNEKENLENLENYWKEQGFIQPLQQAIIFETPLSHQIIPEEGEFKLEDQRAGIVLEIEEGLQKQTIALAYDLTGGGLKWPILNGKYVVRFQPNFRELSYVIRLRQARQIFYPQSQQVYSYESDLIISEKEKTPIEQTLSMNKVYETWDGYRFYLAGIGSSADGELKRIQLAVNYDPAKYFLTYPGAFFVFLGTALLFWRKKSS